MKPKSIKAIERIAKITAEMTHDINELSQKYFGETKNNDEIFIVTNVTGTGKYTPSVFQTFDEAADWLKECSVRNFIAGLTREVQFEGSIISSDSKKDYFKYLKDKDLLDKFIDEVINTWEHSDGDCFIDELKSTISYADGTFNNMQIYKISLDDDKSSASPVTVSPEIERRVADRIDINHLLNHIYHRIEGHTDQKTLDEVKGFIQDYFYKED